MLLTLLLSVAEKIHFSYWIAKSLTMGSGFRKFSGRCLSFRRREYDIRNQPKEVRRMTYISPKTFTMKIGLALS